VNQPVVGPKSFEARGVAGSVSSAPPTAASQAPEAAHEVKEEDKDQFSPGVDAKTIREAVDEMQSRVQMVRRDLQFTIDEDTQEVVVKVLDRESGEVVRQIPSEEVLAMLKRMREWSEAHGEAGKGLLFVGKA
jgi:flagellar protein FlaG